MTIKERNMPLVVNDTVRLRLFVLNSNVYADVLSVNSIQIYFLDPIYKTEANPDGRTLFTSLNPTDIVQEATGQYYIDLTLTSPSFVIGKYVDVWNVTFDDTNLVGSNIENFFEVFPNLWITSPKPLIYGFNFKLTPNRITSGSIQYLTVNIQPDVPRATTLEKYYRNLVITSDVNITMIQRCGNCVPIEEDLRTVIDNQPMVFKDKNKGYYLLDTTDLDCGIYDVFFTLVFGDTTHISPRSQLEIYS